MENINTSRAITTASLVVLLAIGLTWLVIVQQSNNSLENQLDRARLKSETLLSEKLSIQKSFDKISDSHKKLEKQKAELDEILEHRTKVVTTQTLENKNIKKALRFAEDRYKKEFGLNNELREELSSRNVSYSAMSSLNKNLRDSLDFLRGRNAYLREELQEAIITSIDETLISGIKGNNKKVTSKARAAKKLVATVEVSGTLNDLRFVVEGPDGDVLSGVSGLVNARVLQGDKGLTASTTGRIFPETESQKIEITYMPNKKLKAGIYTFKIFNNEYYVGSMKVNLR